MPYTRSRDRVLDPTGRVVGHCYGRTNADRLCSELNRLDAEITRLHCVIDKTEREPLPIGECSKCHTPIYTAEGFCGVCEPNKT